MKEKTGWIDKGTSDAGTVVGVVAGIQGTGDG